MDLINSLKISASGMRAQGTRLRVVAENVANAESLGNNPGDDPYRRKTITFDNVLDRSMNADLVKVAKIGRDQRDFQVVYEPHHPLADESGYVKRPRSEEHTSELQSLMRHSYAVFCLKTNNNTILTTNNR